MTDQTDKSDISVTIGDVGGNITGSIIAGRDVVKNIIVVGQFLDFAKVEGLLPHGESLPDLSTMSDDIDRALQAHLGGNLANVANSVGDILGDILKEWQPKQASAAFPFRRMIPDIAPKLIGKLKALDYWDTFSETGFSAAYKTRYTVIWLNSLNQLLNKHNEVNAKGQCFGLADIDDPNVPGGGGAFVTRPELGYKDIKIAHNPKEPHLGEFATMDNRSFRVFMAGLVIDLMRLASEAANDTQFWGDLVGFLQSKTE